MFFTLTLIVKAVVSLLFIVFKIKVYITDWLLIGIGVGTTSHSQIYDFSSICWWHLTFFKVKSLSDLNYDSERINQWAHQWKMSLNPDPNKQTASVFSRKINSDDHSKLTFNGNQIQQCSLQKPLGLFSYNKFDFSKHLDEKISKWNKINGIM